MHPYNTIDTTAAGKKCVLFYLFLPASISPMPNLAILTKTEDNKSLPRSPDSISQLSGREKCQAIPTMQVRNGDSVFCKSKYISQLALFFFLCGWDTRRLAIVLMENYWTIQRYQKWWFTIERRSQAAHCVRYLFSHLFSHIFVIFWPSTQPQKCYSKVIHRKEVTHSNGQ